MLTNYQNNSLVKRSNKRLQRKKKGNDFDVNRVLGNMAGNLTSKAANGLVSFASSLFRGKSKDVSTVAPLARSMRVNSKEPKFSSVAGTVSIEHTEALVLTSGAHVLRFTTEGLKWLSNVAGGFEEYKIILEYGYVPICPATTTGSIKMAWDYDPTDIDAYTEYQDYFNTADHCISAIWSPGYINPKPSTWLKTGQVGDPRLFSPGSLKYSITDVNAGYMMVRYRIQLRKPQPNSGLTVPYARYSGTYSEATAPLSNSALEAGSEGLVSFSTNRIITQLQDGRYLLTWSTDSAAPTSSTFSGQMLPVGGLYTVGTGKGLTWYSNSASNTANFTVPVSPGGPSAWSLTVFKLPTSPYYNT